MSLLRPWPCHAKPVIVVSHKVYIWARLLMTPPLAVCTAPSSATYTSKRSFRVSASWISPGPVTKVCALFSSRIWPSSSGPAIKKEQIFLESSPSHLTSCVTLHAAVTKYLAKATYGSRRIFRIQLEDAVHHSVECVVGHETLGTCHLQSRCREIDTLLLSRSPP